MSCMTYALIMNMFSPLTVSDIPLNHLDVDPLILTALINVHGKPFLSLVELLCRPQNEIALLTGLSIQQIESTIDAACRLIYCKASCSALDMAPWRYPIHADSSSLLTRRLTFGCASIDAALDGGIVTRGITELVGISASGKTQICMQLCLTVQLPVALGGCNGAAVYLATEDAFPHRRLKQLMSHFPSRVNTLAKRRDIPAPLSESLTPDKLGRDILIEHVRSLAEQWDLVARRLPMLLKRKNIRLIVIDSIAALFRVEYDLNMSPARAAEMVAVAQRLKQLSDEFNVPIVCANQVSSTVKQHEERNELENDRDVVIPALGMSWSNNVNTRLMLTRSARRDSSEKVERYLSVLLAPHIAPISISYNVTEAGVDSASSDVFTS